jgi:branched-chain amino acid transport system permease protein
VRRSLAVAGFVAVAVVVALAPRWVSDFRAFQLATVGVYFIAIVGLNVLTGYSGQISIGHGAFMAIGGYTTAILMVDHGVRDVWTIPVAGLVAGAAGFLFGIPALRLSGLYLALVTFGIAVSFPSLLKKFSGLTGGGRGLNLFGIPQQTGGGVTVELLGHELTNNDWLYYLTWSTAGVLFVAAWLLLGGRMGRALRALRDSSVAAASVGVWPALYKTVAFGISAAFAGIAGSLLAIGVAFVNPDTFPISLSITLLVGAVVAGIGSVLGRFGSYVGPLAGASLIVFLQAYASEFLRWIEKGIPLHADPKAPGVPAVIFGLVVIVVMLLAPAGVGGVLDRALGALTSRSRSGLTSLRGR